MAFNPNEPRDPLTGKWSTFGSIRERIATMRPGERVTIKGHTIRSNMQKHVYRVIIGGETKDYQTAYDAANVVHQGRHSDAGSRHDGVREAAVAMSSSTSSSPKFNRGDRVSTDTGVTGTVESTYTHPTTGEPMVRVASASYIRGSHSIKASKLTLSSSQVADNVRAYRTQKMTIEELQHELNAGRMTPQQVASELQRREAIRMEAQNAARGGGMTIRNFKVEPGQVNAVNLGRIINDPNSTMNQLRQAENMVSTDRSMTSVGRRALLLKIRQAIRAKEGMA